ncbi:lipocalin family protein [Adhaeribacter terreus]|uniref:Lipocalin family protein n=1 Tax=Adhaeribacter terreus TaxID=529703 RepID=A0ABW0E9J1_9BACT
MKNYLFLLAAASAFTFTSCGDDKKEDPTPTPVTPAATKTQLISAKDWKMTKQTLNMNGSGDIDITNTFYTACELDNLEKFAANGTYTVDEGATKCDTADSQTFTTGTWAFTSNETKIKITEGTDETEMEIVELTATKMVVKDSGTEQGITYTAITTFTAQ